MGEQRLPRHGRNHLPTGSDPIPGIAGFIRYVFDNVGEWLNVVTTGVSGNGWGIVLTSLDYPFGIFSTDQLVLFSTDNFGVTGQADGDLAFNGIGTFSASGGVRIVSAASAPAVATDDIVLKADGGITATAAEGIFISSSSGQWDASNDGGNLSLAGEGIQINSYNLALEITADGAGGRVLVTANDDDVVVSAPSGSLVQIDVGGALFEFRDDGTIHGPTGGSIVWDL